MYRDSQQPSNPNEPGPQQFTPTQIRILIGLGIFAGLIFIGVILFFTIGTRNPYYLSPTLNPTLLTPYPLPTFPKTWTPAPTQTALPSDPTGIVGPTSTPMATFTPYTPYPTLISTATIQPYQDGVTPSVIGTSVSGRPIEIIRFGHGPSGRLMVADIHGGNEWNTTALMDQLITYIRDNPDLIPMCVSLYIIRTLNPDGLARALNPDGRVNDNGVDLNRNWDAGWEPDWDRDGCWSLRKTSAGPYPNSEPETQTLIRFVLSNPLDALISYHSAALGIFPAGLPPELQSIRLAKSIADVTDYKYPPIDTGCRFSGGLVDWTALQGIPSVDLELTTHLSTDFEENKNVLQILLHFTKE